MSSTNNIPRPYIVTFRLSDSHQNTEEYTLSVDAYEVSEAVYQASVALEVQHPGICLNKKMTILHVAPDIEKQRAQAAQLIAETLTSFHKRK